MANPAPPGSFDAIVLAGGSARRLGGADKAVLDLGGVLLLDRVLEAVGRAGRVVVVGPRRDQGRAVVWTREEPPGGGPVAALAAGLALVPAPVAVVLAVDLPLLHAALVTSLVDALSASDELDGVVLTDDSGRDQPLAAAYRRVVLTARLGELPEVSGAAMGALVAPLSLGRVSGGAAARDCDTWDEVAAARRALAREAGGQIL
jgi:molybdopterin-guanine dinucleotide biosynthesis protein A